MKECPICGCEDHEHECADCGAELTAAECNEQGGLCGLCLMMISK
jgi:uncharacterized membrane protein YvbJ